VCPNVGSRSLEQAPAHCNAHVATAHLMGVVVLWPSRYRNTSTIHRFIASQHHHTPSKNPPALGSPTRNLGSTQNTINQSPHCYIITLLPNPSITHPITQSPNPPNQTTHPPPPSTPHHTTPPCQQTYAASTPPALSHPPNPPAAHHQLSISTPSSPSPLCRMTTRILSNYPFRTAARRSIL